jgi:hypothetical protein
MRVIRVAVVVIIAAALAGCSSPAPVTPFAETTDQVTCGADSPAAGRVPEGFIPTAALLCPTTDHFVSSPAPSPAPPATPRELQGDLRDLLAALAEPNDAIPPNLACTTQMELVPELWLVDASGRAIHAAWPRTSCGFTKPAVAEALKALKN